MQCYGRDESKWRTNAPVVRRGGRRQGRPSGADLTLFKAMGMGISDLALGIKSAGRPSSASAANFRIRNAKLFA